MSADVLVILLMAAGLVIFVGEPLVRRVTAHEIGNGEQRDVEQLSLQKEVLYAAIRDLEFDFQTGKVDEADYRELRGHLEGEAVQILRALDDVDPWLLLDNELERQIFALRQQQASNPQQLSQEACLNCGAVLQGGENFCPFCGQLLRPS